MTPPAAREALRDAQRVLLSAQQSRVARRAAAADPTRAAMQLPGAARVMQGTLFQYAQGRQAVLSGELGAKCVVLLGGLSDGLLACPYAPALADALAEAGWATCQPVLRTSYLQFGFGSLDSDVEDLDALLTGTLANVDDVCLVGHSTGSQVAAHYVRRGARAVRACVLQAGCSDRETDDDAERASRDPWLSAARDLVAKGDGEEFLPRAAHWAPMTARRYLDLHEKGGTDDYFSSDLSDGTMAEIYASWGERETGCLVAYSGADEYAPKSVDKGALVRRICGFAAAGNGGRVAGVVIPNANHNLSEDANAAPALVAAVVAFLAGGRVEGAVFDSSSSGG